MLWPAKMGLGSFQNQYGAAELSNKQLHIKEDRDSLAGKERSDAFPQDSVLEEQIRAVSSASRTSAHFDLSPLN